MKPQGLNLLANITYDDDDQHDSHQTSQTADHLIPAATIYNSTANTN